MAVYNETGKFGSLRIKNRLYPSKHLGKMARMSTEDYPIWKVFMDKYGHLYSAFMYDYPVGEGSAVPQSKWTKDDIAYAHLTRKRIDAVGRSQRGVELFEVKPRLNPKAIGQAMSYKLLWQRQHPGGEQVRTSVICQLANEDDLYVAMKLGVVVYVIE